MGYSNYKKIETLTKKFNLTARRKSLLQGVKPVAPSSWLLETLELAKLVPLRNEKVKSERVVSPILLEVAKAFEDQVTLFSGEPLEVNAQEDLAGACDFFFTLVPQSVYMESPIISLVEAKDEDMEYGIAQCAAQLYGAKLFNEQEQNNLPFLWGSATDGVEWHFMKLEADVFYIDNQIYTRLDEILGIFHHLIGLFQQD